MPNKETTENDNLTKEAAKEIVSMSTWLEKVSLLAIETHKKTFIIM